MHWNVYLSGEIHTDWRDQIISGAASAELPIDFYSAVTNHEASDDVGDNILGAESQPFWKDNKSAKINAIRIQTHIQQADVVVVRFGDKYKQWNAAFDAGYAAALGKPIITLHDEALIHPLKEVNAAAMAWAQTPQQVVEILKYTLQQK
ncbi:YtoQ family protein [Hahella ganghwensis]|uniref:YtoQ family protein n=1 Tax=Hahella ganghwensis TaxID=286420 RepID=UPI000373A4A3|nr:YtoQ family protein [Hahella ganghwensis]